MLEVRTTPGAPPEERVFPAGPAVLTLAGGAQVVGEARAAIARSSIAIAFRAEGPLTLPARRYGESTGSLAAADGVWRAPRVTAGPDTTVFDAPVLIVGGAPPPGAGSTRLYLAGAAFDASDPAAPGLRARALAEAASHHDRRMLVEADGTLDDASLERLAQAAGFVAGIDVEALAVERIVDGDAIASTEYRRGLRRVGRFPHSPFTGVAPADRARAFIALARRLTAPGDDRLPLPTLIDQITASNHVAQINLSAQLLLLATQTAAYAYAHGTTVDGGAASRTAELRALGDGLALALTDADLARFERLRVELLDAGYFHAPGYETGRPQNDIKFLRDIAHRIVFRASGYAGPWYVSERFGVESFA